MLSDTVHPDEDDTPHVPGAPLDQSDKPRAGSECFISRYIYIPTSIDYLVAAEYLAKGYQLSDGILQRAIQLDCEIRSVHFVWLWSERSNLDYVIQQPKKAFRIASSATFSLSTPLSVPRLSVLTRQSLER